MSYLDFLAAVSDFDFLAAVLALVIIIVFMCVGFLAGKLVKSRGRSLNDRYGTGFIMGMVVIFLCIGLFLLILKFPDSISLETYSRILKWWLYAALMGVCVLIAGLISSLRQIDMETEKQNNDGE